MKTATGEVSTGAAGARAGGFRALYVAAFVAYGDRFAIPPILVAVAGDLHASLGAATAVATVYFFVYGAMQLVYGVLSDRVGRVRVLRAAVIGVALANIVAAAAPTLTVLIAAKALAAAFAAALLPTSLVYVGDRVPFAARQQVIANLLAAGALGTVLATLGAGLLGSFATWRAVFAIAGALGLAAALMLGDLPESLQGQRGAGPLVQIRRVLSHGWAVLLVALALVEGAVMLGFITFLAPAVQAHGYSGAVAGSVVAVYGVAAFAGMQLLKRSIRRTGLSGAALIGAGGALIVLGYLAAALDQGIASIFLASLVIGLGYCFMHSTLQTWATEVVPEARGTATALFVTAVFMGAAIGTSATSGLADAERYGTLFSVAAAVTLLVAVIGALARARYRPGTAQG